MSVVMPSTVSAAPSNRQPADRVRAVPLAVAFLRAINTGNRRITNEDLCAHVESIGFASVSAYQAAGNVIFDPGDDPEPERTLEEGLTRRLGYDVPTFVRSADEVERIAAARPFTDDQLAPTERRVQVAFLRAMPDSAAVESVVSGAPSEDMLVVEGRELFWLPRAGISSSELPVGEVEKAIGPMTIRTHGTVTRIARKLV